mgnify:CR=1 FL=1
MVHARTRTKRIYEVIYFLPVTTTLVAMAIVWNFVLHSKIGPVNAALVALGFEPVGFFSDRDVVLVSLALVALWQLIGFNMILFIAGLSSIPQDLYDAAAVDGADGWFDKFIRVTWPMLGPTVFSVCISSVMKPARSSMNVLRQWLSARPQRISLAPAMVIRP